MCPDRVVLDHHARFDTLLRTFRPPTPGTLSRHALWGTILRHEEACKPPSPAIERAPPSILVVAVCSGPEATMHAAAAVSFPRTSLARSAGGSPGSGRMHLHTRDERGPSVRVADRFSFLRGPHRPRSFCFCGRFFRLHARARRLEAQSCEPRGGVLTALYSCRRHRIFLSLRALSAFHFSACTHLPLGMVGAGPSGGWP
jgi:hypothetical protein